MRRFIARLTAALAAFRAAPAAQQADNAVGGDVNGTLVQAREIGALTVDRRQHIENQNFGFSIRTGGDFTNTGMISGSNSVISTGAGPININSSVNHY